MLSFVGGKPFAKITTGAHKDSLVYVTSEDSEETSVKGPKYKRIDLKQNKLEPVLNPDARTVDYVAGPAGAGKSTYASLLAKSFKKLHPKKDVFFFSRTDWKEDPAYKKIKPVQVRLDQSLVNDPIMIEDIEKGSCIIFDDVNTIHDKNIKAEVLHIVKDILEVGRKMNLSIIITSHLISPPERDYARTVLNELQTLTFFPRGSSAHSIRYVLDTYFGLAKKDIEEILHLPSRWVSIHRNYPNVVFYEHGAYIL